MRLPSWMICGRNWQTEFSLRPLEPAELDPIGRYYGTCAYWTPRQEGEYGRCRVNAGGLEACPTTHWEDGCEQHVRKARL